MEKARAWRGAAPPDGPREEYVRRRDRRRAEAARLLAREKTIANGRLVLFLIILVLAWLAFVSRMISTVLPLLATLGFIVLAVLHDRVIRARKGFTRAVAFYEHGIERLDDAWAGSGDTGSGFADSHHPYTDDLDVFGEGSVYELLCRARTAWGRATLAAWLRAPAGIATVRARQEGVEDLRAALDLREALSIAGTEASAAIDAERLQGWAARAVPAFPHGAGMIASVMPILVLASLAGWVFFHTGPLPFAGVALFEGLIAWRMRAAVKKVVEGVDGPSGDLDLLSSVLGLFESHAFAAPRLRELRSRLETGAGGRPPSRRIAELARLADRLEWARNAVFAPIAFIAMWEIRHAAAIRAWRARYGPAVAQWCDTVGEMEALSSLASHAYEHPEDPFPGFAEEGTPLYEAVGLGHPLIPSTKCVRNDVRLGGQLRLMVISGSNMSGKSTLLRSIGVNAVLAFAGAPVRAYRMLLSPLTTGASIRRNDSLQEGVSRFYAEILRLHSLIQIAEGSASLLFLIDEMLNGTNSHDRRIGSEGVLRGLVERGAIGLVTTHDLALAQIADALGPRAANVHFEDQVVGGKISFDYILRPGVVTKSNALDLMRAVGLDVVGPSSSPQ